MHVSLSVSSRSFCFKSQFLFSRHGSPFLMNFDSSFSKIVQERLIAFAESTVPTPPFRRFLYIPAYTVECLYNQGNFTFKVNPLSFPFCSLLYTPLKIFKFMHYPCTNHLTHELFFLIDHINTDQIQNLVYR